MKWIQKSIAVHGDGSQEIRYEAPSTGFSIESRKRPVPHANGVGSWMFTSYHLICPDGTEKMFHRLSDAKAAAEKLAALTSDRDCDHCTNRIDGECQVWECRFVPKQ